MYIYRDRRELIISWVGVRHRIFWHTGAKFTLTLLCASLCVCVCVCICVSVPLQNGARDFSCCSYSIDKPSYRLRLTFCAAMLNVKQALGVWKRVVAREMYWRFFSKVAGRPSK